MGRLLRAVPDYATAARGLGGGPGGAPDALVVWGGYVSVPAWVWTAPVPVVLAAPDANLLWPVYRHLAPLADLVLTDAPTVVLLRRAGIEHARPSNLFGLDRHFAALAAEEWSAEGRDIDVLFVGNPHPAVQGARLPWVARVAALAARHRVLVTCGVVGAEYAALVRRAKVVANRSARSECNLRALEAAAGGAVLVQERANEEIADYLEPNAEFVSYSDAEFEAVVDGLLQDGARRERVARAARERAGWYPFEALVRVGLNARGKGWDAVTDRMRDRLKRGAGANVVPLAGRVWARASLSGPDADHTLAADLARVGDAHALGALARTAADAEPQLAVAAATGNRVSAASRAEALVELGRTDEALAVLRAVIPQLEAQPELSARESESVAYPLRFDHLRVGWTRAGFGHPSDPRAERAAQGRLLRGRVLELLAELTGDAADWERAAAAVPEWPHLSAGLGRALLRAERASDAVPPLRAALAGNPFDAAPAVDLHAALAASRDTDGAAALRAERATLARGAPDLVAPLTEPPPASAPVLEPDPEPVVRAADALTDAPLAPPIRRAVAPAESEPAASAPAAPAPTPAGAPVPAALHAPIREPVHSAAPTAPATRFVPLSRRAFDERFGCPDTRAALTAFTPPDDTHAVLALVAALRPRRVLEIGTAAGHMTANLTAFAPPDATVYSVGLVAGSGTRSGTPHQEPEVPDRAQFARFANHFGTAYKALLATADTRAYDFERVAPLDYAFVDGGHDYATARSDSVGAYAALRAGGALVWHDVPSAAPWVEVRRAIADLGFPEPVYLVEGTGVAFLLKGEGIGAEPGADSGTVEIAWDGAVDAAHSLALVNRAACAELVARGHRLALVPQPRGGVPAAPLPVPPELTACRGPSGPDAVLVRHRWPPDFTPPAGGEPFVLAQPWEYGALPRAWADPIVALVDEVWVPSRAVWRAYVAAGVPAHRVAVVPHGVDPDRFRPGLDPLPLPTAKGTRLLFVGGTIPRKGFDALLAAYGRAFRAADDVCLVVKDAGAGTFYRGQTAGALVGAFRRDPTAPEVLYLDRDLSEDELPRLYAACAALAHPYRGEGFGLPVLEAMACGLPVVVTAGGPTDEFVPGPACWRVPARLEYFERDAVGDLPTAGRPWWLEPDPDALVATLRSAVGDPAERARRGAAARRAALGFTWARAASAIEDRVRALRARTPVRFRARGPASAPPPDSVPRQPVLHQAAPVPLAASPVLIAAAPFAPAPADLAPAAPTPRVAPRRAPVPAVAGKPRVSLTMIVRNEEANLGACLETVRDLVDEAVVIDTGSTDRTVEIARAFGCKVGSFPWIDHFAAARNAALDAATGDYALWMDADDRLDPPDRAALRELLRTLPTGNSAFVMSCLCPGEPGSRAAGTAVDHVRLFRLHPAHRWTYRVHEQILPALRATDAEVRWTNVKVRHVGYLDPALRRRKLDRDLRLLELDASERPDDPFTLFNLGSVYHELGDWTRAESALARSLAGSHPKDSIVRKAHALVARCRHSRRDLRGAAEAARAGRTHYPHDAELLFLAAGYAREGGDLKGAEALYRELIDGSEGPHFGSADTGLRAVKGRHNLAVMLLEQGRSREAEGLWRAALTHDPGFVPAQVGLGEACVAEGNGVGVLRQAAALDELGDAGVAEAAVLRARWKAAEGDRAGALELLRSAVAAHPRSVGLRVALSHALIAASAPVEELEAAFRGVLEVDPANAQARHNLEVALRNTGRWVEGVLDGSGACA